MSEPATPGSVFAEDLVVGEVHELGGYEVHAAEIVDFARRWDPLPFHLDDDVAQGAFGRLIATGLHSMGILQRLAVLAVL